MFENPLDPVWLVAGAALAAVFGLAGLVLAIYAVRRRRPVLGVVLGVLAVAVLAAGAAISIRAEASFSPSFWHRSSERERRARAFF